MRKQYYYLAFGIALVLASCAAPQEEKASVEADMENVRGHLQQLSSDEFQGRMPFTEGEKITLDYLVSEFEKAGAQPGNNGEWFQEVPMVEINSTLGGNLLVKVKGMKSWNLNRLLNL